jgi:hypothetical protein
VSEEHFMGWYLCLSVRLSVHMIQIEIQWPDVDVIFFGSYAIGDYSKIELFNSLQSGNANKLEVHCCIAGHSCSNVKQMYSCVFGRSCANVSEEQLMGW